MLPGVHDSTESQFRAPEMSLHGEHSLEKVHLAIDDYCDNGCMCIIDVRLCLGSHGTSGAGEWQGARGEYLSFTPAAGDHDGH